MSFLERFHSKLESLYQLTDDARYVIAYSGGVDSHVLLHCCYRLNMPVRAVHVHHGLQSVADEWVDHCRAVCESLNIPLDVIYLRVQKKRGQSPEEAARNARYQALMDNMQGNECLLTAQHLDDQAETLLLQLFRTASSAGLSAMPACRQLGNYFQLRPLLDFSREEIENYARKNALHWVEDPSNRDVSFDRNFIRKTVMPLLAERWPEVAGQLCTVARLQSSNLQVMEDMAAIDVANAITAPEYESRYSVYDVVSVLSVSALKQLSSARLLNLLRYWIIQTAGVYAAAKGMERVAPTRNLLEEIERSMIYAQPDAAPVIHSSGFELRKYRQAIYLLRPGVQSTTLSEMTWHPSEDLAIPALHLKISSVFTAGMGLKKSLIDKTLSIRFRRGGEYFHPAGRHHSQKLKKLYQEAGIPPWERGNIPLLYCNDELIAVIGLWISSGHMVTEGEEGWDINIEMMK
jgi:tRNA(Ile)-lysidine synthase